MKSVLPYEFVTIIGPTACGKTHRAVSLAKEIDGEIISGDSRQVYLGMDLGTGKDLFEYGDIPFHLINIRKAGEKYNLYDFINDFDKSFRYIKSHYKFPILCGGSGLYIESVLSGIKLPEVPENPQLRENLKDLDLKDLENILKAKKTLHNKTDIDTVKRAIRAIEIAVYYEEHPDEAALVNKKNIKPRDSLIIGIDIPRDIRRERITKRLEERLEKGMIEEISGLMNNGVPTENLIYYGLEYKFITLFLIGQISFSQMKSQLEIAIHQFAKRQMTWFRGMEKRGFNIHWLPFDLEEDKFNSIVLDKLNHSPY